MELVVGRGKGARGFIVLLIALLGVCDKFYGA